MGKPLSERQRKLLVGGLVLLAAAYIFLTAKEFVASIFAARANSNDLQIAVRLSPGNADYRHRLGRYFSFAATNPEASTDAFQSAVSFAPSDPLAAIDAFQSAVRLNPHDAHYWFDLAAAYQVTGDVDGQRTALERGLQAEPTAPDVAWEAANFFLVNGDIDRALREFRVVIGNDNSMVDSALQACWRVRPDADALLRDVVPARTDTLLAFLTLLMQNQDTDGAIRTWKRLTQLNEKFDTWHLFEYVRYLIQVRRPDAAMSAWRQASIPLALSAYLPTYDNLVVNGDFSLDVLNGGFDWMYVNRVGVRPLLDATDFHQGQRSLSLTFEGPGISDAGIQQVIPVHGSTTYDFSAYYKSADFEGAGGPQIVLRDAYTGSPLFASDPLTDGDFWKEVHSKFTTPESTTLLNLVIERFPAGSPIRGKLWLDNFQLSPDDSDDDSADNSNRKDKP